MDNLPEDNRKEGVERKKVDWWNAFALLLAFGGMPLGIGLIAAGVCSSIASLKGFTVNYGGAYDAFAGGILLGISIPLLIKFFRK